jgi:hypothetical protein
MQHAMAIGADNRQITEPRRMVFLKFCKRNTMVALGNTPAYRSVNFLKIKGANFAQELSRSRKNR